uniref:Heat shock factor 2-binding protein n=1 Tax=Graphocephala atropunctata TaxID=36148 RepID=A0A1B6KF78_9HEMI
MVSTLEELEAIRTKYKNLQREWDNQQEHLGRIQGDVLKLKSQLKNQSSFCASMGAIMGSLMWKTSRLPNVIDTLLSTNRVSEFLCIVSGSLQSFLDTYNTSLPDVTTNETQFILSLVGTVANMASTSDGRQFLVTDPNGRELVTQLLSTLPGVPEGSGDSLKRVILMSLYNLSINQMGLLMIMDKKDLHRELTKNIENDMNPELRLLSLRLLLSLTMQIPSCQIYDSINRSVPKNKITELTNTTDADMRLLAKDILINLKLAATKFTDKTETNSFLEFNKCKRKPGIDQSTCSLLNIA